MSTVTVLVLCLIFVLTGLFSWVTLACAHPLDVSKRRVHFMCFDVIVLTAVNSV